MAGYFQESGDGAADGAKTLTLAAVAKERHYISKIGVVVGTAATSGVTTVSVKAGSTTIWKGFLPTAAAIGAAIVENFDPPLVAGNNTAVTLVVTAPSTGAGSVVTVQWNGYTGQRN